MWTHEGRLAHVLPPAAYVSATHHARELTEIFAPAWHVVATEGALAAPGAFVSRFVLGTRVLVENQAGELLAFVDRAPPGRGPARSATDRGRPLRLARHGELVFVHLLSEGPGLHEQLETITLQRLATVFPRGLPLAVELTFEHPCNWKIPLENVLETYHVPALHTNVLARHPEIFRFFTPRRDGVAEAHVLAPGHTSFHATMGGESRLYQAFLRLVHRSATIDYVHHHAFPNLVIGHTGFVSFLQIVEPTSPTSCRNVIRLFHDIGARRSRRLGNTLAPVIDRAAHALMRVIMAEDASVYADLQRGLAASTQPGVLGANEERVFAFQQWVADRVSDFEAPARDGGPRERASARPKSG